jgi:hypothetical protein
MFVLLLDNKPRESRSLIFRESHCCQEEHPEEAQARLLTLSRINQTSRTMLAISHVAIASRSHHDYFRLHARVRARDAHCVTAEKLKGQGMKNIRTKYHANEAVNLYVGLLAVRAFLQFDRYNENRPNHNSRRFSCCRTSFVTRLGSTESSR